MKSSATASAHLLATLVFGFAIFSSATLEACNVPVFRYALERWPSDPYELLVFTEGPLDEEKQQLVDGSKDKLINQEFFVEVVDLSDSPLEDLQAMYEASQPDASPWLIVRYPFSRPEDPLAFTGALTQENVDNLLDSPMRREVARQILKGESVVWVLVECGDEEKDKAARETIEKQIAIFEEELELPELVAEDAQYYDAEMGPELKLSFSMLSMSRENPQERMFLKLLENWDPELKTDEEPVAFAMFGRGRALGPIVGEEINPEWIGDVCVYLTGACSCQIKRDNPGWDILLMVDWEGVIRGQYTLAEALPKLTTPAAVAEQTALVVSNGEVKPVKATLPKTDISSTSAAEPTDSETSPGPQEQPTAQPTATPQATTTAAEDGNSFLLPVAIALGGAIVLVVTLSLIVRQVRRGDL